MIQDANICYKTALNGTPPLLSMRFCMVRLPLDFSEEAMFSPIDELRREVEKLDALGWNTERKIYRVSFYRAFYILMDIREEILDASLRVDDTIIPSSKIK